MLVQAYILVYHVVSLEEWQWLLFILCANGTLKNHRQGMSVGPKMIAMASPDMNGLVDGAP